MFFRRPLSGRVAAVSRCECKVLIEQQAAALQLVSPQILRYLAEESERLAARNYKRIRPSSAKGQIAYLRFSAEKTPRPRPFSRERGHRWWRRGDSTPVAFATAWTMPSSEPLTARMRSVLSRVEDQRGILVPAQDKNRPRRAYESLQGRPEVGPLPTPRRCHAALGGERRQVSPM